MIEVIAMVACLVVATGLWFWPKSLLFWPLIFAPAYILRLELFGFPTNVFEIVVLLVAIVYLIRDPKLGVKKLLAAYRQISVPLAILAIGLIAGVAMSADPLASLGIVKGWFIVPLLIYGLTVAEFRYSRQISDIVWPLVLSTVPISLAAIYQLITGTGVTTDGRVSVWFASPNYLALYLVPIILLGLGLFSHANRRERFWIGLILLSAIIAVGLSFSYGGWMALIVSLVVLSIGLWPAKSLWSLLTAAVVSVGALLTQLNNPRFVQMLDLASRSSASVRLQVWATDLLMIKENWIAGIGLGQYSDRYLSFAERLFFPPIETAMLHGHNLFLQFAIELGAAGWAFLVILSIQVVHWARVGFNSWTPYLVAAAAAILAHGLVDTAYWKNDLSLLFWVVIALFAVGYNRKV
jgi:putative inorganic carbon (hco3(-)) transporter